MKRRSIELLAIAASMMLAATGCGTEGIVKSSSAAVSTSKSKGSEKKSKSKSSSKSKSKSKKTGEAKQTLMVYMVGSNLESQVGAATNDLQEMALSGYDPDEMNVVVCAGGASKWWNSSVQEDELKMYLMEDEDVVPVYDMESQNMADPDTLTEFINKAKEEYPAESYSIVLWNHGGGSVVGYGADENYNNEMLSVGQLGKAIKESDVCSDGKFEWIGFDACMMGMVEVADTLKDSANYMIASEEVEAQDGWNYDALGTITDEGAYDGDKAGEIITKAYGEHYEDMGFFVPDYTLSCIDMSKVGDVTEAISDFAEEADSALVHGEYSKIARARDNTKTFGRMGSSNSFDYIDLGCFSKEISCVYPDKADKIENAIKDCVVHNVTNVGRASGLSVYFPYDNTDLMDQMMDKYDSEGYNADYTSFIHDFTAKRNGDDLTEWTVEESDPVADESDETGFSIQLSDEEVANFSKAYATVWEKDAGDESGESYVLWLESLDTALDENGKLSANYDGKIFYLTDDSGDKVPIFAIQTELTDDYSEYVTYITKGHASEDQHNDAVYIRVDKEHPEGVITGIYKVENNENIKCPDKQVDKIEDGDYLLVMYFGRKIRFNDDGTVEPFDTWEESSYWGAEMDVEGQLKVSFEKPSLEHDYIGLFDIRDTQGKEHDTNYLDVHIDGKEGNGKTVYEEALGTVGYYL